MVGQLGLRGIVTSDGGNMLLSYRSDNTGIFNDGKEGMCDSLLPSMHERFTNAFFHSFFAAAGALGGVAVGSFISHRRGHRGGRE